LTEEITSSEESEYKPRRRVKKDVFTKDELSSEINKI